MVIGPTPPGTGVMAEAFFDTSSNATSPTNFVPDFVLLSGSLFMPTSTTTAPSYTIDAFTNSGFPMAAMIISA